MSRHWLLVENLSGDVSGQHVVSLLSEFGSIKAFKYHKKRGMAIVEMSSQADAINAPEGFTERVSGDMH